MIKPLRFAQQAQNFSAKSFSASVLFLAVLCAALRLTAQAPYANPVIGNPRNVHQELPDPFVLKWNGGSA
jgi:hypothetical protein